VEFTLSLKGGDLSKKSAKNAHKKSMLAKNEFRRLNSNF
jgi:hypothetical protein